MAIYTPEPVIGRERLPCRHCLHNERCNDQLIVGDNAALRSRGSGRPLWPTWADAAGRRGGEGGRPAVAVLLGLLTWVRYAVVTAYAVVGPVADLASPERPGHHLRPVQRAPPRGRTGRRMWHGDDLSRRE